MAPRDKQTTFDAIVLGGGAAGLMCALRAGQRGKRVLVLEHNQEVGAKILISGGGRCNFTNRATRPECYISRNPHFCKSALAGYSSSEFITLVNKHKIAYHEKTLGQLFCDGSATQIVRLLLDECEAGKVDVRTGHKAIAVRKNTQFEVDANGVTFKAPALIVATGGLSIPKLGATGFAHDLARQFEIPLVPDEPALVPLILEGDDLAIAQTLAGVPNMIIASCGKTEFHESMVFTHRGISGPSILQISSYWQMGEAVTINLVPEINVYDFLMERKKSRPKAELKTVLGEVMPIRLAAKFTEHHFTNAAMQTFNDATLKNVATKATAWRLMPTGTEGYAKAEVTKGGVDTKALSSQTMQAEKVPGLFFVGEAVDVTGWLGGYNFQWAWASGWAAGSFI